MGAAARTITAGLALAAALALGGCRYGALFAENAGVLARGPKPVADKIRHPFRPEARLALLWIGHATTLLQIDDKMILTDPVFTSTVGQLSARLVEPGLDAADVPPLDAVLISHEHFDHLSQGSLALLEPKIRRIFVPEGELGYLPDAPYPARELPYWQTWTESRASPPDPAALQITAVPVKHVGGRFGLDAAWMPRAFTGYVIRYHGITVYYGGDTAYCQENFVAARRTFGHFDLAILPIAPLRPRGFMEHTHVDPWESLRAFVDLGADRMVPIHYDSFLNSEDEPGDALAALETARRGLDLGPDRVVVLPIGGQRVFLAR